MALAAHLNVRCIDHMLKQPKTAYEWIRFDSNDDCNLQCIYCHNDRSTKQLNIREFNNFISKNVSSIENFQFGCRMEPTLDNRLVEFMETLVKSSSSPTRSTVLQTNGILLHRHDQQRMVDVGLTNIHLSIDTLDDETFRSLRGGARLKKILNNITSIRKHYPNIRIKFIVTVTTENVEHIEELVEYGISIGVGNFVVREMFYIPGLERMDDKIMKELVLPNGRFRKLRDQIENRYGNVVKINCIESTQVLENNEKVREYSYSSTWRTLLNQHTLNGNV